MIFIYQFFKFFSGENFVVIFYVVCSPNNEKEIQN